MGSWRVKVIVISSFFNAFLMFCNRKEWRNGGLPVLLMLGLSLRTVQCNKPTAEEQREGQDGLNNPTDANIQEAGLQPAVRHVPVHGRGTDSGQYGAGSTLWPETVYAPLSEAAQNHWLYWGRGGGDVSSRSKENVEMEAIKIPSGRKPPGLHIPPQDLQQLGHPVEVLRLINKTADKREEAHKPAETNYKLWGSGDVLHSSVSHPSSTLSKLSPVRPSPSTLRLGLPQTISLNVH